MNQVDAKGDESGRRKGIRPDTLQELRDALIECDEFNSNQTLASIFVDARISQWSGKIPEENNKWARVDTTILFLQGDYDSDGTHALVLLLRVLSDRHLSTDRRHNQLGRLANRLEYELQFSDADTQLKLRLETAKHLFLESRRSINLSDLDDAEQKLRRALQYDPYYSKAWLLLGQLLLSRGLKGKAAQVLEEAVKVLEEARSSDVTSVKDVLIQALLPLTERADKEGLIRIYERILELKPKHTDAIKQLEVLLNVQQKQQDARQFEDQGEWDKVIQIYDEISAHFPPDNKWYQKADLAREYKAGLAALVAGQLDKAQERFANVIAKEPDYRDAAQYLVCAVSGINIPQLQKQLKEETQTRKSSQHENKSLRENLGNLQKRIQRLTSQYKAVKSENARLRSQLKVAMPLLSPTSLLDYPRLLHWLLVAPNKLSLYEKQYSSEAVYPLNVWLASALIWLPLFLSILTSTIGTFFVDLQFAVYYFFLCLLLVLNCWLTVYLLNVRLNRWNTLKAMMAIAIGLFVAYFVASDLAAVVKNSVLLWLFLSAFVTASGTAIGIGASAMAIFNKSSWNRLVEEMFVVATLVLIRITNVVIMGFNGFLVLILEACTYATPKDITDLKLLTSKYSLQMKTRFHSRRVSLTQGTKAKEVAVRKIVQRCATLIREILAPGIVVITLTSVVAGTIAWIRIGVAMGALTFFSAVITTFLIASGIAMQTKAAKANSTSHLVVLLLVLSLVTIAVLALLSSTGFL